MTIQSPTNDDLFQSIFETAPIAIAVMSASGVIERANEAFAILCGYDREELRGLSIETFAVSGDTILRSEPFGELLAGRCLGNRCEFEKRFAMSDGTERWVQASIGLRGGTGQYVGHFNDVTGRKHADDRSNQVIEQYQLAASALRGAVYD